MLPVLRRLVPQLQHQWASPASLWDLAASVLSAGWEHVALPLLPQLFVMPTKEEEDADEVGYMKHHVLCVLCPVYCVHCLVLALHVPSYILVRSQPSCCLVETLHTCAPVCVSACMCACVVCVCVYLFITGRW